jgi:hypothetical protein
VEELAVPRNSEAVRPLHFGGELTDLDGLLDRDALGSESDPMNQVGGLRPDVDPVRGLGGRGGCGSGGLGGKQPGGERKAGEPENGHQAKLAEST